MLWVFWIYFPILLNKIVFSLDLILFSKLHYKYLPTSKCSYRDPIRKFICLAIVGIHRTMAEIGLWVFGYSIYDAGV